MLLKKISFSSSIISFFNSERLMWTPYLFSFNVTSTTDAQLAIYDLQGRKVVTILNGNLPAGQYSYVKNLGKLAQGMYVVNLSLDNETPINSKLIKQ